jgi:hypothetical protein
MKNVPISKIKKENETINHCFQYLGDIEEEKFVRNFKNQPHNKVDYLHILRELILGAYLSKIGFCMHYEYKFGSQTPDWCILDKNSSPQCIIELFNFNPDATTSAQLAHQVQDQDLAWSYFVKPNTNRLYDKIMEKASKYKTIVNEYKLPYIISVFSDSIASVKQEELNECLFEKETGIFEKCPEVSGLLFFENVLGGYSFSYKENSLSHRAMNIPSGEFPIPSRAFYR